MLSYSFFNSYKYQRYFKFILIPSIPLFIISLLLFYYPNTWISTPIDHFYIELFGAILASILAFYYISTGYVLSDRFSLFIGIGFTVNSLIDVLHVIISLTSLHDLIFLKYFIPQTWFAGKLFLSTMLMIAIIKFSYLKKREPLLIQEHAKLDVDSVTIKVKNRKHITGNFNNKIKPYYLLLFGLVIFSLFLSIGSLFLIFPFSVIDDFAIHRPYELVPLFILLIALFYFYKNKIYEEKDVLYLGILVFIVINIFGQIIMCYSATPTDTPHNIAHVLKDLSYFIAIIAISLSNLNYNIQLRKSRELIKKQYKQLQESEKVKDEFINIAAHELRNPIQPIMGLSTIMLRETVDKRNKEYLESILNNSKRLKTLTESMLDVAKIQTNTLKIEKKPINLNIILSKIIKEYGPEVALQEKTIYYKFISKHEDIIIEADEDRLTQVISNLLENSLKFTRSGDSITVTVERVNMKETHMNKKDNEGVRVSIIDTGEGISSEIFNHLFSKFTTKNSVKGSGLGLYICKKIIEAHDGKIWAENPINNNGAIFRFVLPIQNK